MATFTQDGITVESNSATLEELQSSFDEPSPEQPAEQPPVVDDDTPSGPVAKAEPKPDKRTRDGKFKSIQAEIDAGVAEKNRVLGESAAAKAERDRITAEIQSLKAERDKVTKPAAEPAKTPATTGDPEPQEENFETYGGYVKAQARWEARQEFREQQQKAQEQHQRARAEHAAQTRSTQFRERLATGKAKYPDFDAVMAAAHVPISLPMEDVITDSDIPADMMWHLKHHPDEAEKIFGLRSQIQQFGEMKKLEARLEAAASGPAPKASPISRAPAPIKPLGSSSNAADDNGPPGDTATFEEHEAYYNRQERRAK